MKRSCRWLCKRVRAEPRGSVSACPSRTARHTAGRQREGERRTACSGSADSLCKLRQRRRSTNRSFCAAGSHPPGVHRAGSARLDRRSMVDRRHKSIEQMLVKSCDLRSNKFRESSPVLGKQAQNFCASMQSYFSQTYRFRTTEPTQIALSTVVAC